MAETRKITFTGALGNELAARLDLPDGAPRAFALFAHCFTCSKDIFTASRVSAALAERGFGVLRFDFTGLGSSEGEFANTNFTSNVGDLVAAADYLKAHYQAPSILIGHSLGGAAVLAAAGQIPEADAVATIAAPCDPAHVAHNFGDAVAEIEAKGEAKVSLGGRPFTIRKQFLEDIAEQKMLEAIGSLRKALLIFHGPLDEIVTVDNAARIFGAAKYPKSFVSLDDADHLLSNRSDAVYVADLIAAWASRYLDSGGGDSDALPKAKGGQVRVTETGAGRFQQSVSTGGRHELMADEPVDFGGTDTGPSPYDLLLAGLGACTSMTMRMYAERKGIKLERASVNLSHQKVHAEDCADCETTEGMVDQIERVIELTGDLSEKERVKLLEIAGKCPVHRTLHSEVMVKSALVGGEEVK